MIAQHVSCSLGHRHAKQYLMWVIKVDFLCLLSRLERDCILELAEGMRPAEPEPEVAAVVEAEVEAEKKSRSSSSSSSSSEPKKDEEEEKKEGEEEKKEEEEKEAEKEKGDEESDKHEDTLEISEVTTIIKTEPLEESETRTQMVSQTRTVVSESHSYTKQTSGTEEMPDLSELSLDAKTTEMSSFSVQSSSHVVSQKTVVSSSSTTERVITSEGVTIENGDMEKVGSVYVFFLFKVLGYSKASSTRASFHLDKIYLVVWTRKNASFCLTSRFVENLACQQLAFSVHKSK